MAKLTIVPFLSLLLLSAQASAQVYKCIKDDKIVFSQTSCPKDYREREITFAKGLTFETSNDKSQKDKLVSLVDFLKSQNMGKEKMLEMISTEISRIQQENDYFDLLKDSDLKRLERHRYWQEENQSDAAYAKAQLGIKQHYNGLVSDNLLMIVRLENYRDELLAHSIPSQDSASNAQRN
ncbi:hypothetical protein [Paraferrimonas haliotis]|uniref:DUF4124 domain-containing protein n=1 Tax=Paraferrimonas haliotis TaxID=2013866 RepID=A0AA37WXY6_9GAMM|nr:hypothetical protein [Paraferrimonas haliotis]GLS83150.1 hypothetical protein GCM10007894_11270 [Paraferrimonas haliotis]